MQRGFPRGLLAGGRRAMHYGGTMIIACPACATRYVVPDNAIGTDGRTVRCAKCKHSWFQDGPELAPRPAAAPAEPTPAPEPAPPPAPPPPPPAAEALAHEPIGRAPPTLAEDDEADRAADAGLPPPPPLRESEPEPPVPVPPVYADPAYGDYDDDEHSRFAHEPLLAPRRNPARMWTLAAALFAVISVAAIGATAWYGLPNWMPFAKPTFAEDQPGLKLDFPVRQQDRHQLPNGTWFFGANGSITNVSPEPRSVPSVLIVLRDSRGRIVHSAEARPPKRVLAPGERVEIREALVPVPKSGVRAEFGWKPN